MIPEGNWGSKQFVLELALLFEKIKMVICGRYFTMD